FQTFCSRSSRGCGRAIETDVFVFARGCRPEASVANTDLQDARSRRDLFSQRLESAPAGAFARRSRMRGIVARVARRQIRPHFSPDRQRILSCAEVIEVSTLTPIAVPDNVPRNLVPAPHF